MTTPAASISRPAVRLSEAVYFEECERFGLMTDAQRAGAFGVTRQTVNEIQNGHRVPSNEFIAGVMGFMAPRRVRFEDVFTWGAQ